MRRRWEVCGGKGQADRAARATPPQVRREHAQSCHCSTQVQRIPELTVARAGRRRSRTPDLQVGGDCMGVGTDQYRCIDPTQAWARPGGPGDVTGSGRISTSLAF